MQIQFKKTNHEGLVLLNSFTVVGGDFNNVELRPLDTSSFKARDGGERGHTEVGKLRQPHRSQVVPSGSLQYNQFPFRPSSAPQSEKGEGEVGGMLTST